MKFLRALVSYIPSNSLLSFRYLKDFPLRILGIPHETDFYPLRKYKKNELTVLDVGANRGQSIESFRSVLGITNIIAVEPNPILASFLRKHYPEVTVHAIGLGANKGTFSLYVPRYGYTYWDTRASIDPHYAASFLGPDNFAFFDEKRGGLESFKVPVLQMDDLKLAPDILKIDTEGYEAEVLRGGERTLDNKPLIILEGANDAAMQYLMERGYHPYHCLDKKLVSGSGGLNTYFLHPDQHKEYMKKFN